MFDGLFVFFLLVAKSEQQAVFTLAINLTFITCKKKKNKFAYISVIKMSSEYYVLIKQ